MWYLLLFTATDGFRGRTSVLCYTYFVCLVHSFARHALILILRYRPSCYCVQLHNAHSNFSGKIWTLLSLATVFTDNSTTAPLLYVTAPEGHSTGPLSRYHSHRHPLLWLHSVSPIKSQFSLNVLENFPERRLDKLSVAPNRIFFFWQRSALHYRVNTRTYRCS